MPTRPPVIAALSVCVWLGGCSSSDTRTEARVDPARLNDDVRALASDEFEGRAPGTVGEARTLALLTSRFQALGLEPASTDGTFLQRVPLSRTTQVAPASITVTVGNETRALAQGADVAVTSNRPVSRITVKDSPLVFFGYGVSAPERGWDDFKGVDPHGKIMVVLVNDPDYEVPPGHPTAGKFDGRALTYYGRWTYKFEEAARRGAAGVLVVHETAAAGYEWAELATIPSEPQMDIVRADPNAERVPAQVAEELFSRAGLDFAAAKASAQRADFHPIALAGLTVSIDFRQIVDTVMSNNVIARIVGATRPEETVLFGAHWDGLGRGAPNAQGDDIYNGAVDNASGVAALLDIARVFAAGPRPQRSVVFAAFTAEEHGLLGSFHYANHPLFPLEKTAAMVNLDGFMPGPVDPAIPTIGYGKSELDGILAERAALQGRRLIGDPRSDAGGYFRSDQLPLAKKGVPGLYEGAPFLGATDASKDYVAHRYHQPTDEWDPSWSMEGAAADVQLMYEVGRVLADSRAWPRWTPGSEFEAARNASAAQRP